jgi:hypothetical protein
MTRLRAGLIAALVALVICGLAFMLFVRHEKPTAKPTLTPAYQAILPPQPVATQPAQQSAQLPQPGEYEINWLHVDRLKPAQAGKKMMRSGLYWYGNPMNSANAHPVYANLWWEDRFNRGIVIEPLWRQVQPNLFGPLNRTPIDTYVNQIHAWNAQHPDQKKYWVLRVNVLQNLACVKSPGAFGVPGGLTYAWVYKPNPSVYPNAACLGEDNGILVPQYANATLKQAIVDLYQKLGAAYDSDPYLVLVQIAVGLYGERHPARNDGAWAMTNDWLAGNVADRYGQKVTRLTAEAWIDWVETVMQAAHDAFPTTQLVLLNAPAYGLRASNAPRTGGVWWDRYHNEMFGFSLNPPIGIQPCTLDEYDSRWVGAWVCGGMARYWPWWPVGDNCQWYPEWPHSWYMVTVHLPQFTPEREPFRVVGESYRDFPVAWERGNWAPWPINATPGGVDTWWALVNGLSYHPDIIFPQNYAAKNSDGTVYFNVSGVFRFDYNGPANPPINNPMIQYASDMNWMLEFATKYLGVDEQTTPGVWWVAYNAPASGWYWDLKHFDHEFYLYRMDIAKNGRDWNHPTSAPRGPNENPLPGTTPANGENLGLIPDDDLVSEWNCSPNGPPYFEGDYCKRTNQATGDTKAYFDIDDGYKYGYSGTWRVAIKLLDRGTDTVRFYYKDPSGALRYYTIAKTGTNKWKWFEFYLTDFYHGNAIRTGAGGADFYLDSMNDGQDEYYHMIELNYMGGADTPTPTYTPTPGPSPTPTNTPTPTKTFTPTYTPSPTVTPGGPTLTPTPTPTAAGTAVMLRNGVNGYTGCQDTYLDQYNQTRNYITSTVLYSYYDDRTVPLIKFDLSPIPSGATIVRAELEVTTYYAAGGGVTVTARRLLRDVDYNEATWLQYKSGYGWEVAGAQGSADRTSASYGSATWSVGVSRLDVTSMVQYWIDHPSENYGMLIDASGPAGSMSAIRSSDWSIVADRPGLYIEWAAPTPTPMPTSTPTPTPTPTGPTPPPATIIAQNDTNISQGNPNTTYSTDVLLRASNQSNNEWAFLIRFPFSGIPGNSYIHKAQMCLYSGVYEGTPQPLPVLVSQVRKNVGDMTTTTWLTASTGTAWQTPGAKGPNDIGTPAATSTIMPGKNDWDCFDLNPNLIAAYVNNQLPNYGFKVGSTGGANYTYVKIRSLENANNPGYEPYLKVWYATPTPTPTPTDTPTPTATYPPATVTASRDTNISQFYSQTPFPTDVLLRTSNKAGYEWAAMLYFDLSDIPAGSDIQKAELRLYVSASYEGTPTPQVIAVRGVRVSPGDYTQTTWQERISGQAWQTPGAKGPSDVGTPAATAAVMPGANDWVSWNILDLVRSWVRGLVPNHGVKLTSETSPTAWAQIKYRSLENPNNPGSEPYLYLEYITPTPTLTPTPTDTPLPTPTPRPTATPDVSCPSSGHDHVFPAGAYYCWNPYPDQVDPEIAWYNPVSLSASYEVGVEITPTQNIYLTGVSFQACSWSVPVTATVRVNVYVNNQMIGQSNNVADQFAQCVEDERGAYYASAVSATFTPSVVLTAGVPAEIMLSATGELQSAYTLATNWLPPCCNPEKPSWLGYLRYCLVSPHQCLELTPGKIGGPRQMPIAIYAAPIPTPTPSPTPRAVMGFTEFVTNPNKDWNLDGVVSSRDQWVEICNLTSATQSMKWWRIRFITDQDVALNYVLPRYISLAPGSCYVFWPWSSTGGTIPYLDNAEVWLYNDTDGLVDYVQIPQMDSGCFYTWSGNQWVTRCPPAIPTFGRWP